MYTEERFRTKAWAKACAKTGRLHKFLQDFADHRGLTTAD
jgi:hypothetical protein